MSRLDNLKIRTDGRSVMNPNLRLEHNVRGGRQHLEGDPDNPVICWQCYYGECERCLKGQDKSPQAEPYRHPCSCIHWWAALDIGDTYAEIKAQESARDSQRVVPRRSNSGLRKAG